MARNELGALRNMELSRYPKAIDAIDDPGIFTAAKICFFLLTKHSELLEGDPMLDITIADAYVSVYSLGWKKAIPVEVFQDIMVLNQENGWDGIIGSIQFFITRQCANTTAREDLKDHNVVEIRLIPQQYRVSTLQRNIHYSQLVIEKQLTPSQELWLKNVENTRDREVISHLFRILSTIAALQFYSLDLTLDHSNRDFYSITAKGFRPSVNDELVSHLYRTNDRSVFDGEPLKGVYLTIPDNEQTGSYNLVLQVHRRRNTILSVQHLSMATKFIDSATGRRGVKRQSNEDLIDDVIVAPEASLKRIAIAHRRLLPGGNII